MKTCKRQKCEEDRVKQQEQKHKRKAAKTKGKALTLKELDELVKKLDGKRCNFVSERLKSQYAVNITKFSTIKTMNFETSFFTCIHRTQSLC